MADEIERKYLLNTQQAETVMALLQDKGIVPKSIRQGYLHDTLPVVRMRIVDNAKALMTIKGARRGLTVPEHQWYVPLSEGQSILSDMCSSRLSKKRYEYPLPGTELVAEIDFFEGPLSGLAMVEVEFDTEEHAREFRPTVEWIAQAQEVTTDLAYSNLELARRACKNAQNKPH
jgi:adenylate cyclase